MIRLALLTISDKGYQGEREDLSGKAIEEIIEPGPFKLIHYQILPDEKDLISSTLKNLTDEEKVDLILTTGGTGLSPRDVTPEATRVVVDKEVPGIAEAMRLESLKKTPHGMLSRAVAGIRKKTLIINLPGSPKAVRETLAAILPALPHAIEKLQGDPRECGLV
jgi:molybdenum cofactor synthesis domain-containing protein